MNKTQKNKNGVNCVIGNNYENRKEEELQRTINEMVGILPLDEKIRIYYYLLELYFY